jgi:hypothetical protein
VTSEHQAQKWNIRKYRGSGVIRIAGAGSSGVRKWKLQEVNRIYRSSEVLDPSAGHPGSAGSLRDLLDQVEVRFKQKCRIEGLTECKWIIRDQVEVRRIIRIAGDSENNASTRYNFSNSTVDAESRNRYI